ncbi:hypothetical protein CVT26_009677 [Gymnopilus dilepis]|uniref:Uncharacterized protein n=1 Tax=Gymnopilus dilepis TaxID=231916 RepID=A0A409YBL9_9AGAR|nr:hypothetical protein CVT26_009677 [Gymnopilus dilepis]
MEKVCCLAVIDLVRLLIPTTAPMKLPRRLALSVPDMHGYLSYEGLNGNPELIPTIRAGLKIDYPPSFAEGYVVDLAPASVRLPR